MRDFGVIRRAALVACIAIAATALGGCREEEQGRVLSFQKGSYLGEPDQNLSAEQVEALRQRAAQQRSE